MILNKNVVIYLKMAMCVFYLSLSNAASLSNDTDPFIQRWDFFDGIKTYSLNITKSAAPGQDYHIDYTFAGGYSATDMCTLVSTTSFSCATGEKVTRDDRSHSVKINSGSGSYVFFDPKNMPSINNILGNWVMNQHGDGFIATYKISIMPGPNDSDFNILTSFSADNGGGFCSYSVPDVYHATENPDGTKTLSDAHNSQKKFKYDPFTNQITNPDPDKTFKVGNCVWISESSEPVLFTKK